MAHEMDYAEVKDRIAVFYARFPKGSLATIGVEGIAGGVIVRAQAWRTPDDQIPASGTGYCPMPGKTNFEKDREVQNAETSAWGRTLEAAGIPRKQSALVDEQNLAKGKMSGATAAALNQAYKALAQLAGPTEAKHEVGIILKALKAARFDDLSEDAARVALEKVDAVRIERAADMARMST